MQTPLIGDTRATQRFELVHQLLPKAHQFVATFRSFNSRELVDVRTHDKAMFFSGPDHQSTGWVFGQGFEDVTEFAEHL